MEAKDDQNDPLAYHLIKTSSSSSCLKSYTCFLSAGTNFMNFDLVLADNSIAGVY